MIFIGIVSENKGQKYRYKFIYSVQSVWYILPNQARDGQKSDLPELGLEE